MRLATVETEPEEGSDGGHAVEVADVEETPVFLSLGAERLFGVISHPPSGVGRIGVILVPGAWLGSSMGTNRMLVRLGRLLASRGYSTLRFEYQGVGESSGSVDRFSLEELLVDNVRAAADLLRKRGVEQFILAGWCHGGLSALAYAAEDPAVIALALLSSPLGGTMSAETRLALLRRQAPLSRLVRYGLRPWVIAGLLDPNRRRKYMKAVKVGWRARTGRVPDRPSGPPGDAGPGRGFLRQLRSVIERGIPVLFLYGTLDKEYHRFAEERSGPLGALLERGPSVVDVSVLEGDVHALQSVESQDGVIARTLGWLGEHVPASVEAQVGSPGSRTD